MIRIFLLVALSTLIFGKAAAQEQKDHSEFEGHYLGLQGNELLRQLLNLGNAGLPDNPYFINYSYTSAEGNGLNIGFALSSDGFTQQNGFNSVKTEIDNFSIRIGYEKRERISKRFFYSAGIDLLLDRFANLTITDDNFGSNEISTEAKTSGWGLGPRFMLNYQITDRLIIGTEANYYFKSLTEKFETVVPNFPSNNLSEESDIKKFKFAVPSVLWITIRL